MPYWDVSRKRGRVFSLLIEIVFFIFRLNFAIWNVLGRDYVEQIDIIRGIRIYLILFSFFSLLFSFVAFIENKTIKRNLSNKRYKYTNNLELLCLRRVDEQRLNKIDKVSALPFLFIISDNTDSFVTKMNLYLTQLLNIGDGILLTPFTKIFLRFIIIVLLYFLD